MCARKNSWFQIWEILPKKRKIQAKLIFGLTLLTTIMESMSVGATLPIITVLAYPEKIYHNQLFLSLNQFLKISAPSNLILPLGASFILLVLCTGMLRLIQSWFVTSYGFSLGAELGVQMYRRVLNQPYEYHLKTHSSVILSGVLNKSSSIVSGLIFPVFSIGNAAMLTIIICSILLWLDPVIPMLIFFSIATIYGFLMLFTKKTILLLGKSLNKSIQESQKLLQEGLGGIRDVVLNRLEKFYIAAFSKNYLVYTDSSAKISILSSMPRFAIETVFVALIIAVAIYMLGNGERPDAVVPLMAVIAISAQRLLPALQQTYSSIIAYKGHKASIESSIELLELPLPDVSSKKQHVNLSFEKNIHFNNVSFQYMPNGRFVLKDVNLTLKKGLCYGFIGASGGGKSTFLDILMGLLHPTKGAILVDDIPLSPDNIRSWQSKVSYVSQNIFLSDSTISENIAFGLPVSNISLSKVINAAKSAAIDATIKELPLGYDTQVGERGVRFSGGQRQRLGIARALYKSFDLIVLDEITSSLDSDTENEIMKSIEILKKNVTIVIVSHRPNTLKMCDEIYMVKDGCIVSNMEGQ